MKAYETSKIHNVALAGHSGAGKTSLVEALLYTENQTDRLGNVTQGNTVSDYDPEEIRRQHSISASLVPFEFNGAKINLLDLPGRRDFVGEMKCCLRAADTMVLVLDAAAGVETGTAFANEYADQLGVKAKFAFINKMDKERADFNQVMEDLASTLGLRPIAVTLPVGAEDNFKGVIDLFKMKMIEKNDRKPNYVDIPAEMADAAAEARTKLIEAAAEGDDALMMKFLEEETLTDEEIISGMHGAVAEGRIVPVACGCATHTDGVTPLLNIMSQCAPIPTEGTPLGTLTDKGEQGDPFVVTPEGSTLLYIFKTVSDPYAGHLSFFKVMRGSIKSDTHLTNLTNGKDQRVGHLLTVVGKKTSNVDELYAGDIGAIAKLDATHTFDTLADGDPGFKFSKTPLPKPTIRMAVEAKGKADEDKIGIGFHRLMEQDPTLRLYRDPEIHQTILEGMGDAHLDVAVHHLKELAKVEVELHPPKVPYRETITKKGEGQGKYKKQSGGRGQYGDCWIKFEPLSEGSGFQFEWAIVGGVIPTKYQPAVEKGLIEALQRGVLARHPTVDVKATCYDGSFHDVDSSEMAFKVAASLAFKSVLPKCNPILLEPIVKATILVPEEFMGDVMGDLNGKRGKIMGMEAEGKKQRITALVPMSEMFTYSRDLRSITRGAGVFETEFDHYERVPGEVQEKIVAEAVHEKDGEE